MVLWNLSARARGQKKVRIVEFDPSGIRNGRGRGGKGGKARRGVEKQLTPEQFWVTRQAGTERPGTGKYATITQTGFTHCICCNTVLFDSKTKFESGTGWPSFWQPIAKENVAVPEGQLAGNAAR